MARADDRRMARRRRLPSAFSVLVAVFWVVVLVVVLYPLWLIVVASVSDPDAVIRGRALLWPVDFSLMGYRAVLEYRELWVGYLNSILYTTVGTVLSVLVTMSCAYALTRDFPGRRAVSLAIVFTMLFSGGLIPIFLNVRSLGLYNTRLVMVLMNLVSVWNLMVARMHISSTIPDELFEAATIDGAGHLSFFLRFVLPLSGGIMAVLAVYYGVARWNDYFTALVMLRDQGLFPLQLVIKDILASYNAVGTSATFLEGYAGQLGGIEHALRLADVAKYCCIVIATVPPVVAFLLVQRHMRGGLMVGSLKE